MLTLYRITRRHPVYFICFLVFVVIASVGVCCTDKIDAFIRLNTFHTSSLDIFFLGLTYLGDGIFSLLLAALVLLFRKDFRLTIHIVIAYLASGLVAQVMKNSWMAPRPRAIVDPAIYKYFLAGISHSGMNSFPSGHTTSAFALATILALHAAKKGWGAFFLLLAVGVAYSRIYLGQHFLPDVTMGAILGTVSGLLVYAFVNITLRRRTSPAINDHGL